MSRIVRGVALYKIMLLCIWNFRGNSWAVGMQKLYDCVASHQKSNEFRDHDEIIRWNSWVFRGSRFWHMHHQTTSHKQGCVASCTWHQLISISRELRVVWWVQLRQAFSWLAQVAQGPMIYLCHVPFQRLVSKELSSLSNETAKMVHCLLWTSQNRASDIVEAWESGLKSHPTIAKK